MKIRNGFVSNSSSSSFIIGTSDDIEVFKSEVVKRISKVFKPNLVNTFKKLTKEDTNIDDIKYVFKEEYIDAIDKYISSTYFYTNGYNKPATTYSYICGESVLTKDIYRLEYLVGEVYGEKYNCLFQLDIHIQKSISNFFNKFFKSSAKTRNYLINSHSFREEYIKTHKKLINKKVSELLDKIYKEYAYIYIGTYASDGNDFEWAMNTIVLPHVFEYYDSNKNFKISRRLS